MDDLFASGHVADLIVGVLLVEAVLLTWWHRRRAQGLAPRRFAASLAAGLFLVLALRCVLTGSPWPWAAALLAAGGLAHAVDLWQRWRH